jgi:hypothetical protein
MTAPTLAQAPGAGDRPAWPWPIDPDRYNRRPGLTAVELQDPR